MSGGHCDSVIRICTRSRSGKGSAIARRARRHRASTPCSPYTLSSSPDTPVRSPAQNFVQRLLQPGALRHQPKPGPRLRHANSGKNVPGSLLERHAGSAFERIGHSPAPRRPVVAAGPSFCNCRPHWSLLGSTAIDLPQGYHARSSASSSRFQPSRKQSSVAAAPTPAVCGHRGVAGTATPSACGSRSPYARSWPPTASAPPPSRRADHSSRFRLGRRATAAARVSHQQVSREFQFGTGRDLRSLKPSQAPAAAGPRSMTDSSLKRETSTPAFS